MRLYGKKYFYQLLMKKGYFKLKFLYSLIFLLSVNLLSEPIYNFQNAEDEIRFNKNYENQLKQANQWCEKLEKISYYQLLDLVKSGQITRITLSSNNGLSKVKTQNNTFAASIAPDKELLALFSANNIDIAVGYC